MSKKFEFYIEANSLEEAIKTFKEKFDPKNIKIIGAKRVWKIVYCGS